MVRNIYRCVTKLGAVYLRLEPGARRKRPAGHRAVQLWRVGDVGFINTPDHPQRTVLGIRTLLEGDCAGGTHLCFGGRDSRSEPCCSRKFRRQSSADSDERATRTECAVHAWNSICGGYLARRLRNFAGLVTPQTAGNATLRAIEGKTNMMGGARVFSYTNYGWVGWTC